jgi:sugar phosphate isomerase/epimerase
MAAPIALQLYSVREASTKDYLGVVRKVAEIGYAGVEPTASFPGTTAEAAGKLFKELGLVVPSAHLPMPVGADKNKVIDMAKALGCPVVVTGKGPDDFKTLETMKRTCDLFNEAYANVSAAGLSFGLHNHWWEYTPVEGMYGYEVMLKRLDPAITYELDTYWIKTAGVDPAAIVKRMGKRSPLLHIKDGPCVKAAAQTAVGDGTVDVPAIVKAGGKHTKWLIVELDSCATDMMTAVTRSLQYLVKEGLGRRR